MYYPKQKYFTCNTKEKAVGDTIGCLVGADALSGTSCSGTPPSSGCLIAASDVPGGYAAYTAPACNATSIEQSEPQLIDAESFDASYYDHSKFLDSEKKYRMFWRYVESISEMHVALQVETAGWLGWGVNTGSAGMGGADMVTAWVNGGKVYMQDRHAAGSFLPAIDASQDLFGMKGFEVGPADITESTTAVLFRRKVDSCNNTDDRSINEGSIKVSREKGEETREEKREEKRHKTQNTYHRHTGDLGVRRKRSLWK